MAYIHRIPSCFVAALVALSMTGQCFAAERFSWKFATLAPQNVGYAKDLKAILLPALSKATDGELAIKVYWGGVMGDDRQYLQKMRIGQLQGAGLSAEGTLTLSPNVSVLSLPFLFNNYEEVDYIKKTMISRFDKVISADGFRLLLWLDQDFDQIYSTKLPIANLADFSRARFIIWSGVLEGKFLERLDTHPVISEVPEIPPSIKSGVADAAIAPALFVVGAQLYSSFRYINPMKCRYFPAFTVCTNKAWNQLKPQYQKAISEGREIWSEDFCELTRNDSDNAVNAMKKYGLQIVNSSPEEIRQIRDKVLPLWDELSGNLYPRGLLNEVKEDLAQYRATLGRGTPGAEEKVEAGEVATKVTEKVVARVQEKPAQEHRPVAPDSPVSPPAQAAPNDVRYVQEFLPTFGYDAGPVDGVVSDRTREAVSAFQKDNGMAPDGAVTLSLVEKMKQQAEHLQSRLAGQGFAPGPVDGVLGSRTRAAVSEFQKSRGWAPTGIATRDVRAAMGLTTP